MGTASQSRSQSKPIASVTGRLGRVRCRGYMWLVVLAFLTPRRIVAGALAASAGTAGVVGTTERRPAPVTEQAPRPQPVVVRHPLPEGVAEEQVQKWVPNRRVSGRTELAPWQSVDATRARNPQVLQSLLQPAETEVALAQSIEQKLPAEGAAEMQASSARDARRFGAADIHSGTFSRLNETLSGESASAG